MKKVISVLAVLLVLSLSVMPVFADSISSPKATVADYDVIVVPVDGGTVTYIYITGVDDDGHQQVRFVAQPDDEWDFTGWEFDGEYTVIEGDLTDYTVTVDITTDVTVKPGFKPSSPDEPSTTGAAPEPTKKPVIDDGSKSPQTGSDTFAVVSVIALCLIGGAAALAFTKKVRK